MKKVFHNADEVYSRLLSLEDKFIHVGEETASYYIERDREILSIYFEWSNGRRDWFNNFDFPAKPYRDMGDRWYAHRGFVRVWKTIEPCIRDEILDESVRGINIFGYSHGGAIALLCHEYCKFNRPNVWVYGYGFGAPRVIWGRPGEAVRERLEDFLVIRRKGDLVTHLPPAIFGYWHPNTFTLQGDKRLNCIDAHRPESYIEALEGDEIIVLQSGEVTPVADLCTEDIPF